ncbi:hypothetical protein QN085_08565 [Pseudomonas sp. M2(2023)]|uniref:hypothetical protein n=1 Tax=Pseudomonas sp. M2(2023) TaxID=3049084 RepID=UPI0025559356|nr:hypothetical protein [Pseudomonas sp. M2(2023)]WIV25631.1 hypothetical protein QN085_08565 [Pseudomonas sp. M2(2023)]
MSLDLITLKHITIRSVHGDHFKADVVDGNSSFKARFSLSVEGESKSTSATKELHFSVGLEFEATLHDVDKPFFKIEIAGNFKAAAKNREVVTQWINSKEGAHVLGATLYPYLRSLAKPLIEGLGASHIDFPWSTPPLGKVLITDTEEDSEQSVPLPPTTNKRKAAPKPKP